MIEALNLSKAYRPGAFALKDVSFRVEKGEFVFLTGPSGAGKSTLLRLLLRADTPSDGDIIVSGRNLARMSASQVQAYRRTVGFVFQDFKLIARKSVLDNVALVPRLMGMPENQVRRRVTQALNEMGLADRQQALPPELSGGEQQRVAIARALVTEPLLFLADEPTGNLDPVLSLEVMSLFRTINARGTTVLIATHDRALIRHLGKRVITLAHGHVIGDPAPTVGTVPAGTLPGGTVPGGTVPGGTLPGSSGQGGAAGGSGAASTGTPANPGASGAST